MQDQSPTLNENEILPLQEADRTADNPMATVMAFASTLFSLELVGGMAGGIDMEQPKSAPSPNLAFDLPQTLQTPTTPNMMA